MFVPKNSTIISRLSLFLAINKSFFKEKEICEKNNESLEISKNLPISYVNVKYNVFFFKQTSIIKLYKSIPFNDLM